MLINFLILFPLNYYVITGRQSVFFHINPYEIDITVLLKLIQYGVAEYFNFLQTLDVIQKICTKYLPVIMNYEFMENLERTCS